MNHRFAVLTCGGVCPGMNDVVRSLTLHSYYRGVTNVYGIPYGFRGLHDASHSHTQLTPRHVRDIHLRGGTILGTSRDRLNVNSAIHTLQFNGYSCVFVIGGNGGNTAASHLHDAVTERGIPIQVVALPKSIDNDIDQIDKCFGFDTAVHQAKQFLQIARNEADAVPFGVTVVKVMGRDSGFIAACASPGIADICLIPERPITIEDTVDAVTSHLTLNKSCVMCVAEGFHLSTDVIMQSLTSAIPYAYIKYIDPSYLIRGGVTSARDHRFCHMLGDAAVYAALQGYSGITVATKNNNIHYFPTKDVIQRIKRVQV